MKNADNMPVALRDMKLRSGDFRVLAVCSMEQIIGTALSTVVGIVIPLLTLLLAPKTLSSGLQGLIGAAGLIGISIGAMVIGRLIDDQGYLRWMRICPTLIAVGGVLPDRKSVV